MDKKSIANRDSNLASTQTCDPVKMEERSGYKKTKLGWIPEEWEVTELGKIGQVVSGLTYSPQDVNDNGTLVLRSSNIQRENLSFEDTVYVDTDGLSYNPVIENDILICVRNGSKHLIGKNTLITKEVEGMAFGAFMSVFRSDLNNYLIHYFKTDIYNKEIHKNLGATINSINGSELKRFKVPLPPRSERQKIATILSTWDNAISKQQQLIAAKQAFKKGLMQLLLTGKKRFAGFEGEWRMEEIGKFGKVVSGLTFKPENISENGVLVLRSSNIQNGQLEYNDNVYVNNSEFNPVEKDDILICVRNGSKNLIGKNALITEDIAGVAFGAFMSVFRSKRNGYLKHLFETDLYRKEIHKNLGATINSINSGNLKRFKFLFPKDEEQQKIASVLSTADKEIELLQSELAQLQEQKRGLMQRLLTGEVRVKI